MLVHVSLECTGCHGFEEAKAVIDGAQLTLQNEDIWHCPECGSWREIIIVTRDQRTY